MLSCHPDSGTVVPLVEATYLVTFDVTVTLVPFSASLTGSDQLFAVIVSVAFFPTTVTAVTQIGLVPVEGILIDHPLFIVPAVIL